MTLQQQTDAYQFFIVAFGAAPGTVYMDQLNDAYGAGMTSKQIVNIYTTKDQFTSRYPDFLANNDFATSLINNVVGNSATAAAKAEAVVDITAALTSGFSRGDVIFQVFSNLANKDRADVTWGNTAKQFDNQVAVAKFVTQDQLVASTDLAVLRGFLNGVTQDVATVQTAKDAALGANGGTFSLTPGVDTPAATAGNDTINAFTVNAAGTAANTLTAFDNIDGGTGTDTLNLYTDVTNNFNDVFPASATVKNVEVVNILNQNTAADFGDASKFVGVQQLWQVNAAVDVTNLGASTAAGFRAVEATVGVDIDVSAAAAATTVTIALDGLKGAAATGGGETINRADIDVDGAALTGVTVAGTLAQKTTTAGSAAASLALNVVLGNGVQAATVNSAVATVLTIENAAGSTKDLTSVDASASAGAITYTSADTEVATIKGGSGNDTLTVATATVKDDATTAAVDETVSALVDGGAGKDAITINTIGAGTTTVNAGDGDDTVTLTADGTGKLTVNLGAGNDVFKGAGAVSGTDVVDGGDGTDTLLLNMVGSANIGAFANFETFDTAALAKTLDVDILATKNTVTEFVATADVGIAAVLTNVGAGVSFRATGDMTTNALTLTQKVAGALTVMLDADGKSTTVENDTNLKAVASNATSLKAVFAVDSAYAQNGANLNEQTITLTGTKATALEVVSGGTEATNVLDYTSGVSATAAKDLLASITISGDKALTVTVTESAASFSQVTSINASALTAALTISTAELKAESAANTFNGGTLTLGSGADVVTITQGASIASIGKGTVENATAQGAFDVFTTGGAVAQAADVAATGTLTVKDGLFTFNGTGPATLAAAIALVDAELGSDGNGADGDAVVFEYIGNSYVYVDGGAGADLVVKLTGVTGLTGLSEVGTTDNLYVF
jgi:hypothetical protein